MKSRKIMSMVVAIAMFAALAVSASAYGANLIGDINGWGHGFWGPGDDGNASDGNGVTITGDGSYTVWIEFDEAIEGVEFISLIVHIATEGSGAGSTFVDYPDASVAITSLKADGTEIAKTGNSFMSQEDDVMRVWVYNPWGPGDNGTYVTDDSAFAGATRVEVTFSVTGMSAAAVDTVEVVETREEVTATAGNTNVVSDAQKDGADTGIAGIATISAAALAAAGAIAFTRKRK
jgi:hypothetical protein